MPKCGKMLRYDDESCDCPGDVIESYKIIPLAIPARDILQLRVKTTNVFFKYWDGENSKDFQRFNGFNDFLCGVFSSIFASRYHTINFAAMRRKRCHLYIALLYEKSQEMCLQVSLTEAGINISFASIQASVSAIFMTP